MTAILDRACLLLPSRCHRQEICCRPQLKGFVLADRESLIWAAIFNVWGDFGNHLCDRLIVVGLFFYFLWRQHRLVHTCVDICRMCSVHWLKVSTSRDWHHRLHLCSRSPFVHSDWWREERLNIVLLNHWTSVLWLSNDGRDPILIIDAQVNVKGAVPAFNEWVLFLILLA